MRSLEDLAGALIDAARQAGASAADALVTRGEELGIGTRGGLLEEVERSEGLDLGLRVLVGQRQACVSSSDTRPAAIADMAVRAVAMAREAPVDPWCGLSPQGLRGTPVDHATLGLDDGAEPPDPGKLEDLARALEAAALAVDGVAQVDRASAGWQRGSVTLATSDGFVGGYTRSTHSLVASAIAGSGTGMESDYDYATRRDARSLPSPEEIGRRAGERAIGRLGARKAPRGKVPVVFDRRVSASLISHLISAINGVAVARGASWLKDSMDEPLLPDWADLVEEPLRPAGGATRPFDGEAIAARASAPIVTGGVLRRWLLDCATARQLGLETTGNARRGTGAPPSPGVSNIRLLGGEGDLFGLLGGMGKGLLVTSLIGSSVNPTTGAYSRGASGFWIEGGAIAYPVSEVTIAGNLPEMMRGLTAADDGDPHMNAVVPSLLVDGLVVA